MKCGPPQRASGGSFFAGKTATLDRLTCHVTTLKPGEAPHPPHQHPEEELIIVKEGTLEAMQKGRTTKLGSGSVIFEASNDLHGLRNVGATAGQLFCDQVLAAGNVQRNEQLARGRPILLRRTLSMVFAKRVFLIAGVYGLIVLLPQYFLEAKTGRDYPPAVTHPEFYYGFVGVALAWQVAFLIIARDPVRYRLMMIPSMLEKVSFGVAAIVLFAQGRVAALMLAAGITDLLWCVVFFVAFQRTRVERATVGA